MQHKSLTTTFATIWNNFATLFRLIDYRILLTCLALTIVLGPMIWIGFIRTTKQVLEIAAVVITGLFTFGLIGRFALTHHLFFLWTAGFMAISMSREIHFTGSDEVLLIGWPMLLGIALWRYDAFKSYLENPFLIKFLAGGFLFTFFPKRLIRGGGRGYRARMWFLSPSKS